MEIWKEIYKGNIPKDDYEVQLMNSDEKGLLVNLKGKKYHISIDFGYVRAIRMLEEGIVQEGVYSDDEIEKYKEHNFENVIYELEDGEFGKEIQTMSAGFIEISDVRHYVLITQNFNIDIITEWEPEFKVGNI